MSDDNEEKEGGGGRGGGKKAWGCASERKNKPEITFLLSPKFTHLPEDQKNYFPVE